jgi:hypothetical protein
MQCCARLLLSTVLQERGFKPEHDFVHSSKECPTCLVFHPKRDEQLLVVGSHTSRCAAATDCQAGKLYHTTQHVILLRLSQHRDRHAAAHSAASKLHQDHSGNMN